MRYIYYKTQEESIISGGKMILVKLVRGSVLLSGIVLSSVSAAQDVQVSASGAGAEDPGEIVVTALRREQRLQDVPAAISVLSSQELRAKSQYDLRDYLTTVPGVNFAENNVGGMRITIRGVSDGVGATSPLSGVYIDEAPVTESTAGTLDPDIFDVERVEVLKGPQGTLYGSGAMGGTVRIITKKPVLDSYEGTAEGSLSAIHDGGTMYKIDAVANAPLVTDKVALRVSAGYRYDGGWIYDLPRQKANANTIEKKNVRAQLLLKPGDRTSITLGLLFQDVNSGLPPFDDLVATYNGQPILEYQSGKIYRQSRTSEAWLGSLTINHEWDGISLTSATNYLKKDTQGTFDLTTSQARLVRIFSGATIGPLEGLGLVGPVKNKQFTEEVRIASSGEARLSWLIGGFFSDVRSTLIESFDFSQAPSLTGKLTSDQYYRSYSRTNTRQIAGFGEITYNVTDQLALIGGLRVFNVRQRNISAASGLLNDGDTISDISSETTSSTKKALIQYKPSRDHTIYASAVEGYRNGGPNSPVPQTACGTDLQRYGYSSAPSSYGPDKLWNYEIGSKNSFLGGKAQLNASAFLIKWDKIQNTVALACGLSFTDNTGKAESKGVEIESSVNPVRGLRLAGSLSYIDAKLTQVAQGVAGSPGDPLPLIAKWSWNASALYEVPVADGYSAFIRGEVNHVGDRWNTYRSITSRAVNMAAYTMVSARVGIEGRNWSAAVFATNLTNARSVLYVNPRNYENVGRPRTIGVNVRAGF